MAINTVNEFESKMRRHYHLFFAGFGMVAVLALAAMFGCNNEGTGSSAKVDDKVEGRGEGIGSGTTTADKIVAEPANLTVFFTGTVLGELEPCG